MNAQEKARVEQALTGEQPELSQELELRISGRPVSFNDLSWGRDGEGIARILKARISESLTNLPPRSPVTLTLYTAEVPTTLYVGRTYKKKTKLGRTELEAATGGWWLERLPLGKAISYTEAEPWRAALEALGFAADYSGWDLRIEKVEEPPLTITGKDAFTRVDYPADILEALQESYDYTFRDTRNNGCLAIVDDPTAYLDAEIAKVFTVGRDLDEEDFDIDEAEDEYSSVLAYRKDSDSGAVEVLAEAQVQGSEAPGEAVYLMDIASETPNPYEEAAHRVHEKATALARRESPGSFTLPYIHPFLEEGQTATVLHAVETEEYDLLRRWRCRIEREEGVNRKMTYHVIASLDGVDRFERRPERHRVAFGGAMVSAVPPEVSQRAVFPSPALYPAGNLYPSG